MSENEMNEPAECQKDDCNNWLPLKDLILDEKDDNALYCESCFDKRDRERTKDQKEYFVSEVLWELVLAVEENELYEELGIN